MILKILLAVLVVPAWAAAAAGSINGTFGGTCYSKAASIGRPAGGGCLGLGQFSVTVAFDGVSGATVSTKAHADWNTKQVVGTFQTIPVQQLTFYSGVASPGGPSSATIILEVRFKAPPSRPAELYKLRQTRTNALACNASLPGSQGFYDYQDFTGTFKYIVGDLKDACECTLALEQILRS